MREIIINERRINDDSPCYVIAEIGHNHGGCLGKCIKMIKRAKELGISAVKLQKRTNRELYTEEYYNSFYNSEHSYGRTYGEHREALEFGELEYREIRDYCKHIKIDFGVTAFDRTAADFIAKVGVDFIKIASGDIEYHPLLEHVSLLGYPIIASTGGCAGTTPVLEAQDVLTRGGSNAAILHCTSGYPAATDELNLRVIREYRALMQETVIGWSCHSRSVAPNFAAYTLGARIIEAHFTLDRTAKGTDHAMSFEPDGFRFLVGGLRTIREALGDGEKRLYRSELEPLKKQWKNPEGKITGTGER